MGWKSALGLDGEKQEVGWRAQDEAEEVLTKPPAFISCISRYACCVLLVWTACLTCVGGLSLAINWPILVEEDFAACLRSDGEFHTNFEVYRLAREAGARAANAAKRRLADMPEGPTDEALRRLARNAHRVYEIKLIYATRDGSNIFTADHLPAIRSFEQQLKQLPDFDTYCMRDEYGPCELPSSVVNFFYPSQGGGGLTFDGQGELFPVREMLASLSSADAYFLSRDFGLSKDRVDAELQGNITRSVFRFCIWYSTAADMQAQEDKFRSFISNVLFPFLHSHQDCGGDVRVYYFGDVLQSYEVSYTVWQDARLAYGSMAFIFLYLLGHLKSISLTLAALASISLSFPLAYGLYCIKKGAERMLALNFLSLFVVLGVGADDVFVLYDVWCHSRQYVVDGVDDPYGRRMWYMYRKAGMAIFATSATTAASFFANLVSSIGPLRDFGFFMGVCITANWLAVATMFPLALKLHTEIFIDKRFGKVITEMDESLVRDVDRYDTEAPRRCAGEATESSLADHPSSGSKMCCRNGMLLTVLAAAGVALPLWALYGAMTTLKPASGLPKFFPPDSNLGALQELQQRFGNETPADAGRVQFCDGTLSLSGSCEPAAAVTPRHISTSRHAFTSLPTDDLVVTVTVPGSLAGQTDYVCQMIEMQLGLNPGSLEIEVLRSEQMTARRLDDGVKATLHFHSLTETQRRRVEEYLQSHPDLGGIVQSSAPAATTPGATPRPTTPTTSTPAHVTVSGGSPGASTGSTGQAVTRTSRTSLSVRSTGTHASASTQASTRAVKTTSTTRGGARPTTAHVKPTTMGTAHSLSTPWKSTSAYKPAQSTAGTHDTSTLQRPGDPTSRSPSTSGEQSMASVTSTSTSIDVSHIKKASGLPKERRASVNVVWGLLPNMGDAFDTRFNFASPSVRAALVNFCKTALSAPQLLVANVDCWPEDFLKHVEATGASLVHKPYLYEAALRDFLTSHSKLLNMHTARRYPSWDVAWVSVNFQVNVDTHSSGRDTKEYVQAWKDFVAEQTKAYRDTAEKGTRRALGTGLVVCDLFVRTEAEDRVLGSAFSSWLMSVSCALIAVIAFTRSALLSGIATFAIFGTAACSLFTITAIFRWDFGLMEAVALIVFCGFSVDYPLHVVQAYVQERKRGAAVTAALSEVGCAITSGCVTTVGAAAFLLFCQLQLFKEFGQMLVVNMLYSLAFALVWLPSVLEALNLCSPDDPRSRYDAGADGSGFTEWASRHGGSNANCQ